MSKTSLILLLLLLFVLSGFGYLYVYPLNYTVPAFPEHREHLAQTSQSASLSLNPLLMQTGQNILVQVLIDRHETKPNIIQLEIGYDPAVVTAVSITPGNFFTTPTILLNNINLRTGRISYALSCTASVQTSSTPPDCINQSTKKVATITFAPYPSLLKKETTIKLLPKTLLQTNEGTKIELILQNATLVIPGLVMPQATTSAKL